MATLPHCLHSNRHRRGFANAQLIIVLAILAVVGLLLQLQSGSISISTGSVKKTSSSKRSKAPALIPPNKTPATLEKAADKFITQRSSEIARIDRMQRETIEAYARMDGKSAASILQELDTTLVVEILAKLKERDIARILEYAEPAKAAEWTSELLKHPEFSPIPDSIKPAAVEAGVYDDLPELLEQVDATTPSEEEGATEEEIPAAEPGTPDETGASPAAAAQSTQTSPASDIPPEDREATDDPLVLASLT